jgi:hypothetical protein
LELFDYIKSKNKSCSLDLKTDEEVDKLENKITIPKIFLPCSSYGLPLNNNENNGFVFNYFYYSLYDIILKMLFINF